MVITEPFDETRVARTLVSPSVGGGDTLGNGVPGFGPQADDMGESPSSATSRWPPVIQAIERSP